MDLAGIVPVSLEVGLGFPRGIRIGHVDAKSRTPPYYISRDAEYSVLRRNEIGMPRVRLDCSRRGRIDYSVEELPLPQLEDDQAEYFVCVLLLLFRHVEQRFDGAPFEVTPCESLAV